MDSLAQFVSESSSPLQRYGRFQLWFELHLWIFFYSAGMAVNPLLQQSTLAQIRQINRKWKTWNSDLSTPLQTDQQAHLCEDTQLRTLSNTPQSIFYSLLSLYTPYRCQWYKLSVIQNILCIIASALVTHLFGLISLTLWLPCKGRTSLVSSSLAIDLLS